MRLITMTVMLLTAAEPKPLFEDTFDGGLARQWNWVKQTEDMWRLRKDGLEFRNAGGKQNVIAVTTPDRSRTAFAVEVTITSLHEPTQQYEQVGFTWLHEGRQRFKFVKERIDGKLYVYPGKKPMAEATVQFRVEVTGDKFVAFFKPGAKGTWQKAFGGGLPKAGSGKDQIGLMCYHGPKDAEHWVRFDDFRIVALEPGAK